MPHVNLKSINSAIKEKNAMHKVKLVRNKLFKAIALGEETEQSK
jgi:hypothetical protein